MQFDKIVGQMSQVSVAAAAPWGRVCDSAAWAGLLQSWEDLRVDTHMADGSTDRLRRYATFFSAQGGQLTRNPERPHFQLRAYNRVHGGVERCFAPMRDGTVGCSAFRGVLTACLQIFTACENHAGRAAAWHVEAHQFRVAAAAAGYASPTPEGLHSDGRDYVFMLLLGRRNIVGGETRVLGRRDRRVLFCDTLSRPGEALFLNDREVLHGVSPVGRAVAQWPAHRDMLVLTFCNTLRADSLFGMSTHKYASASAPAQA